MRKLAARGALTVLALIYLSALPFAATLAFLTGSLDGTPPAATRAELREAVIDAYLGWLARMQDPTVGEVDGN